MTRIIGITGGIASGKSRVSAELAEKGAFVISADEIAHRVLDLPAVQNAVREHWGSGVFETDSADPKIDRKQLAKAVFAPKSPKETETLNRITHPRILEEIKKIILKHSSSKCDIIVLDAPLLYETGLAHLCSSVIFVDTDFHLRATRAAERGWTEEELRRRESAQLPVETKRAKADFIISNNGSEDALCEQLESFLKLR